jgi:hypothetical protein
MLLPLMTYSHELESHASLSLASSSLIVADEVETGKLRRIGRDFDK